MLVRSQNLCMLQYNIYYDTQCYMACTSAVDTEGKKGLLWGHVKRPCTPATGSLPAPVLDIATAGAEKRPLSMMLCMDTQVLTGETPLITSWCVHVMRSMSFLYTNVFMISALKRFPTPRGDRPPVLHPGTLSTRSIPLNKEYTQLQIPNLGHQTPKRNSELNCDTPWP